MLRRSWLLTFSPVLRQRQALPFGEIENCHHITLTTQVLNAFVLLLDETRWRRASQSPHLSLLPRAHLQHQVTPSSAAKESPLSYRRNLCDLLKSNRLAIEVCLKDH